MTFRKGRNARVKRTAADKKKALMNRAFTSPSAWRNDRSFDIRLIGI
jgi:hypothetical protein